MSADKVRVLVRKTVVHEQWVEVDRQRTVAATKWAAEALAADLGDAVGMAQESFWRAVRVVEGE